MINKCFDIGNVAQSRHDDGRLAALAKRYDYFATSPKPGRVNFRTHGNDASAEPIGGFGTRPILVCCAAWVSFPHLIYLSSYAAKSPPDRLAG